MIDTSPPKLWEEIRNAEKARDSLLATWKRQMEAYVGPFYSKSYGDGSEEASYDPNNHAFQFIAWMLPQLVYHNPKCVVRANRTGATEVIAKAHKHALDRWCRDEDLASRLQMVAVDFLSNFGAVLLTMEEHPTRLQVTGKRKGKPAMRPVLERIPQDRFIRDPQATSEDTIQFAGHVWLTTKEDLLDRAKRRPDEGWNVESIEGLSEGVGVREQFKNRRDKFWDIDRKQIAIYDVWVRDAEEEDHPGEEDGFFGTIYTLAVDQSDGSEQEPRELREPRPFYGSPSGPYHVADVYPVSNEPHRLAPLIAVEAQNREWNRLSRSINKSAADYKRMILVNSAHEDLADLIASGEHDLVIPIPGLDKDEIVINLEVGGITQEMLATEARAKEIVERASGFNEAAQGQVSGRSTATEAQLVSQNSSVRTDFVMLRFHQFVSGLLRAVSRFFWYDEEIQFPLGPATNESLGLAPGEDAWFTGGDHDPKSGLTFEDLEFDIEPMSMKRVSEASQQQLAQAVLQGTQLIGGMAAQMPWVDVRKVAEAWGDAHNLPDFADSINYDLAAQIGLQGMLQGAAFPAQPEARIPGPSGSALPRPSGGGQARAATPMSTGMLQPQTIPTQPPRSSASAEGAGVM